MQEQEATPSCRNYLWEMIFSDVARGSSHPLSHFSPLRQPCPKFGGFFQSLLPFLSGEANLDEGGCYPHSLLPIALPLPMAGWASPCFCLIPSAFFFLPPHPMGHEWSPPPADYVLSGCAWALATPHSFSSLYTQYLSQSLECSVVGIPYFVYPALGGLTPGWPGPLLT